MNTVDTEECGYTSVESQPVIISGCVENADYIFQRTSKVKPIAKHYENDMEPEYIKYSCPICVALGNKHQLLKGSGNCPLCNVNLVWDNI